MSLCTQIDLEVGRYTLAPARTAVVQPLGNFRAVRLIVTALIVEIVQRNLPGMDFHVSANPISFALHVAAIHEELPALYREPVGSSLWIHRDNEDIASKRLSSLKIRCCSNYSVSGELLSERVVGVIRDDRTGWS